MVVHHIDGSTTIQTKAQFLDLLNSEDMTDEVLVDYVLFQLGEAYDKREGLDDPNRDMNSKPKGRPSVWATIDGLLEQYTREQLVAMVPKNKQKIANFIDKLMADNA